MRRRDGRPFFRRFVDAWIVFAIGFKLWQFAVTPDTQRASAIMLAAGLIARLAIFYGRLRLARYLMVIVGSAGIIAIPILANGVRSPSIALMAVMIILSGWMLGRRAMACVAIVFVAAITFYWLGEVHGWIAPRQVRMPAVPATIWTVSLIVIGALVWSLIANYEAVHDEETRLRRQLDAANTALTAQLAERTELLAQVQSQRDTLERLATHDALTGLPAARLAWDRLQMAISRARRANAKVALLFVDLDGFKAVNDGLGHDAGDEVLKQVARRLQESVRAGDTVARIGGDEFLVVLDNLPDRGSAASVAKKILAALARPVLFGQAEAVVGASIGIALYPDDAADPRTLRQRADNAMYRVKKSGKNGFALADASADIAA